MDGGGAGHTKELIPIEHQAIHHPQLKHTLTNDVLGHLHPVTYNPQTICGHSQCWYIVWLLAWCETCTAELQRRLPNIWQHLAVLLVCLPCIWTEQSRYTYDTAKAAGHAEQQLQVRGLSRMPSTMGGKLNVLCPSIKHRHTCRATCCRLQNRDTMQSSAHG